MNMHSLMFEGKTLRIAGETWTTEHPIADACLVGDVVVVIFDCMAGPRHSQFRNAAGFDVTGRRLWTAEHPTNDTVDAYVKVLQVDPLVLWSFACFRCTIDPTNGKLVDSVFTK